MGRSENSRDKLRFKIMAEEIARFNRLIKGHERILAAIGRL